MVGLGRRHSTLVMIMIPSTAERVTAHTSGDVNRGIQRETEDRIDYYAGHIAEIDHRLQELDREWDIERALEANASALAFAGVALGATVDRRWLALPTLVTVFLFQHAVQGWCPPLPILRRMGFRTAKEINQERYALKALRGDFKRVEGDVDRRAAATRAVGIGEENAGGRHQISRA